MSSHNSRRGAAMIIVACVLAVVCMLSLTLLFSVSRLLAGAETKRDDEQSRLLTVTLSQELERQLTQPTAEDMAEGADSLWRYLRTRVWQNSWPYYNEDESGHSAAVSWRSFAVPVDQASATAQITLYWLSDAETYRSGERDNTILMVRVVCAAGGQESTVTSEYSLSWEEITEGDPSTWHEEWSWSLAGRE